MSKRQTEIEKAYEQALGEIEPIVPVFAKADGVYVFEHPAYPFVVGGGPTIEEAIQSYQRALLGFVADRIQGKISPAQERLTSGRGGARAGAGRPVKNVKTSTVRVPEEIMDIIAWLKDDAHGAKHVQQVRRLMQS